MASFIAAVLTNPNVRKGRLVRTGGQMVQLPQGKGPLEPDWHPLYLYVERVDPGAVRTCPGCGRGPEVEHRDSTAVVWEAELRSFS